jgi:hypothetical protein
MERSTREWEIGPLQDKDLKKGSREKRAQQSPKPKAAFQALLNPLHSGSFLLGLSPLRWFRRFHLLVPFSISRTTRTSAPQIIFQATEAHLWDSENVWDRWPRL